MNKETLDKANRILRRLKELELSLGCFEYDANLYERNEDPTIPEKLESTNPRLIIEYDDVFEGSRELKKIPMDLSESVIEFIKQSIKEEIELLENELSEL